MAPRRRLQPGGQPDPAAGNDVAPRVHRPTAAQFERRLLHKLGEFYAAALVRTDLGHSAEASLDAILHSGHSYGTLSDPVSNIVAHASAYLSDPGYAIGKAGGFADLRRVAEYSLAGLVCLLESGFPTLTRVDAYSVLLSSGLNLEGAMALASRRATAPVPAEVEELPPAVADAAQRG